MSHLSYSLIVNNHTLRACWVNYFVPCCSLGGRVSTMCDLNILSKELIPGLARGNATRTSPWRKGTPAQRTQGSTFQAQTQKFTHYYNMGMLLTRRCG